MPANPPKQPGPERTRLPGDGGELKLRVGGHHSDFDELSWHLTYRAAKAAQDEELPQSPAEAKFVEQMLGNEAIDPASFPFNTKYATVPKKNERNIASKVLLVALIGAVALLLVPHLFRYALYQDQATEPHAIDTQDTTLPTATPRPTTPSYNLAPYDRTANEVIAEMLALAEQANPGLIWFTTQQPELTDCTMPSGQPGLVGNLDIRWGMGDYDAIRTGPVDGNTEWHLIQQLNDAADEKMIEAWIGQPLDAGAMSRFPIEPLHGNWYFGYIFPGLNGGSSAFDLNDGVGIIQLETLCLQPPNADDRVAAGD